MKPVITLCTDFGDSDAFVGCMKGVILGICPTASIVDITHKLPPFDIRSAARMTAEYPSCFPETAIHLCVVDPGVGSDRNGLVIHGKTGTFVGPDNGVFTAHLDDAIAVLRLDKPAYWRLAVSATFHGRDIFAPVAAHLAAGILPTQLGSRLEQPVRVHLPQAVVQENSLTGSVCGSDSFGNIQTNISETQVLQLWQSQGLKTGDAVVEKSFSSCKITCCGTAIPRLARTYADGAGLCALINSRGYLEIAQTAGNAWQALGAVIDAPVTLSFPDIKNER